MAKNFLDSDPEVESNRPNFTDGFKFGFGFFVAWLLGSSLLALIATGAIAVMNQFKII